jgi:high-affinity nickel-transport protein
MEVLPNDWPTLCLTVFALGLKHGLDPDHVATIDGLTRYNLAARPCLARWAGTLFSLGHGAVVCLVAVAVALAAARWQAPVWLEDLGAWTSILLLLLLAAMNVRAVWRTPPQGVVASVGVKSRLFSRARTSHPALVCGVGALFAVSFDTLSQAALFAIAATSLAGWGFALLLGLLFMGGMMVTDGLNGWWVARLLAKADRRARIASRAMALTVAGLAFLVSAYGLGRYFLPGLRVRSEGLDTWLGLAVAAVLLLAYLTARRLADAPALASAPKH